MTEIEKKIRKAKYRRHTQEMVKKVKDLMNLLIENEKESKIYRENEFKEMLSKNTIVDDEYIEYISHKKNVTKLFNNRFYEKVYFNNKKYKLKKLNDSDENVNRKKEEEIKAKNIIVNILQTSSEEQLKKEMTYLIKNSIFIGEIYFRKIINYFIEVFESINLTNEMHKKKSVYLIDVLYTLDKIPLFEIRKLLKYIKSDERKLEECIKYKSVKLEQSRSKYKKNSESIAELITENSNKKIEIILNQRLYKYLVSKKEILSNQDRIYILSILKEDINNIDMIKKQEELIDIFEIAKYFESLKKRNKKLIESKKAYGYLMNFFKNEYQNIEYKFIIDETNIPVILKNELKILGIEKIIETYNNTIVTKNYQTKKCEEAIIDIYSIAEVLKNISPYNNMYVRLDINLNSFKNRTEIENYILFNKNNKDTINEILNFKRSHIQTISKTYKENLNRYIQKENTDEIKLNTKEDLNILYKNMYMEEQKQDIIYTNIIKEEGSIQNIFTVPINSINKNIVKMLEDMIIYFKIVEISRENTKKSIYEKQNLDILLKEEMEYLPIDEKIKRMLDILFYNETKLKILLYQNEKKENTIIGSINKGTNKETFENYLKKQIYLRWTKNNPEYLRENILKMYEETKNENQEKTFKKYGNGNVAKCILPYKVKRKKDEELNKKYIRKLIDLTK